MGFCLSCLGLNRQPSHEPDEIDRILANPQQPSYGSINDNASPQPDEEELRRQREELEHITSQAADHMIDVLNPSRLDITQTFEHEHRHGHAHQRSEDTQHTDIDEDEDEWLNYAESAGMTSVTIPKQGALTMDINLLREEPQTQRAGKA